MDKINKEAISPISVLSLWNNMNNFLVFDNFIIFFFNPKLQKKFIENKVYTDEEMKYLLHIYILMDKYLRETYTVEDEIVLWNEKTDYIEKMIIKLLSLPSMEKYMHEIRKNPCYKWIWDFY